MATGTNDDTTVAAAPGPVLAAPAAPAAPTTRVPAQAPAAAPPAAPPSDGGEDGDKPGYWAADWREKLAAGDSKTLAQLQRYGSPEDVWKKARALESRVSAGDLKPTLKKGATADEVAEYRKSHGIPDKADGYDLKGIKVDEADQPLIDRVLAAAFEAHAAPDAVKAIIGVWPKIKEEAAAHQAEADQQLRAKAEDTLRAEWGTEFRRNMGLVHQLLDSSGAVNIKENLLSGRMADGTPIGSSPEALKMLLGVALTQNPTGLVMPSGGGDPVGSIKDQLAAIAKVRREKRSEYNKDTAMQAKERDLITAAQRMGIMDASGNMKP